MSNTAPDSAPNYHADDPDTMLQRLAERIHKCSVDHGFWPPEGRNFGEMIALAHSEASEALESHRSGEQPVWHKHQAACPLIEYPPNGRCRCNPKPEGIAVELADVIIRCLDTLYSMMDVNIDELFHAAHRIRYEVHGLGELASAAVVPEFRDGLTNFGEHISDVHMYLSIEWSVHKRQERSAGTSLLRVIGICMKLMQSLGASVDAVVLEKVKYNESRPYKHGRAY